GNGANLVSDDESPHIAANFHRAQSGGIERNGERAFDRKARQLGSVELSVEISADHKALHATGRREDSREVVRNLHRTDLSRDGDVPSERARFDAAERAL